MSRRNRGSRSGLGSVSNLVKQAGMGMLGAMVVSAVASKVAPQYAQMAGLAGAYLAGGVVGVASQFVISGMPSLTGSTTSNW